MHTKKMKDDPIKYNSDFHMIVLLRCGWFVIAHRNINK